MRYGAVFHCNTRQCRIIQLRAQVDSLQKKLHERNVGERESSPPAAIVSRNAVSAEPMSLSTQRRAILGVPVKARVQSIEALHG